jgi:predicted acetyltransferase
MKIKLKNLKLWQSFGTKSASIYLVIALTGAAISCGNRKTTQSKTSIKSDSLSVENTRILKQNIVLHDIGMVRALDPLKPFFVDGKEYFNASIIYDKSAFNNFELLEGTKIIELKKDVFVKKKDIEKTDYTILYLGIIFIIVLFVFLWFYLPKIKKPL